jgi:diguanylate cyclase
MRYLESRALQIQNVFKTRDWLTAAVLALSLLVTYQAWQSADAVADKAMRETFRFRVLETTERIQQRIMIYEHVLHAAQGLFNASEEVTRKEFRRFIEMLELPEDYPGIQGVGFSKLIQPQALKAHLAAVRAEGFPDYHISPPGERPVYSSVVYLEPFAGHNRFLLGRDMLSEPVRRAAMEQARDTGRPALTAKLRLAGDDDREIRAGFLMFLPVYENPVDEDSSVRTLAQRRAALVGWVYAPFGMDDFMAGLTDEYDNELDIEIYDESISDASRMYDSNPHISATSAGQPLRSMQPVVAADRHWTVATTALPAFEQRMASDRPALILRAGVSISLLLALLTWVFLDDRARALHAADQAMQLALYDTLTGLPNRKLLEERLSQALIHARRSNRHVALLFIDLDKFKPVNDNYGHAYGDLLLKAVAMRLHDCMRESDTAARLSGDEFVAILLDMEAKTSANAVARKILTQLSQPFEISGHVFEISASIGVAFYPDDAQEGKALMKAADAAMYAAKNSGPGTVRFATEGVTEMAREGGRPPAGSASAAKR